MRETRNGAHWVAAYFAAVFSGSFAFVLILLAAIVIHTGSVDRIADLTAAGLLFFIIVTFFASFTAWLPVLLVHIAATRFSINNVVLYVTVGALTGYMQALWVNKSYFYFLNIDIEWIGAPSGAIGGFVFWLVTGRFVNRREATT